MRFAPDLPDSPTLVPLEDLPNPLYPDPTALSPEQLDILDAQLLPNARAIQDPASRSLALDRVARTKIFAHEYQEAHTALHEAGNAVLELQPGLVRDLRIMAIVTTLLRLAHDQVQEAMANESLMFIDEMLGQVPERDRLKTLEMARQEKNYAIRLVKEISNTNFRSEQFYKIVETEAETAQQVAEDASHASTSRPDLQGLGPALMTFSDRLLESASNDALQIDWAVWRDKALQAVTMAAARSSQYERGMMIARKIPQPAPRADSMIQIAEGMAREKLNKSATGVYSEAARSVASIPMSDPREILAGVLIDSLISVGRFDDARASVSLLSDPNRKLFALGAVAESQGRRGLAASARRWIANIPSPEDRSLLTKRLEDGIIAGVDRLRIQVQAETTNYPGLMQPMTEYPPPSGATNEE